MRVVKMEFPEQGCAVWKLSEDYTDQTGAEKTAECQLAIPLEHLTKYRSYVAMSVRQVRAELRDFINGDRFPNSRYH